MTGIYKLLHTKTGKYYIGSSTNIDTRLKLHMSMCKHNRHNKRMQELYNIDPNFTISVIEECRKCDLKGKEKKYLKLIVGNDPLCINYKVSGYKGNRDKKYSSTHKNNLSISMIGKNGKARLNTVTEFISPTGEIHRVVSIKQFAKQFNLGQSSLNAVANGTFAHHKGWRLSSTSLNECSNLPTELKDHINLVSPSGNIVKVKSIWSFERNNNITVYRNIKTSARGNSIDEWGRGWYVQNELSAYTFINKKTGQVIENVISSSTLAKKLGIKRSTLQQLISQKRKQTHSGWVVTNYKPIDQ